MPGRNFCYDANGNQLRGWNFTRARQRDMTWTSFNKPKTVMEASQALTFWYGGSRDRFKEQNDVTGQTTLYVDGLYEKQTVGATITHVHYIFAAGEVIAIYKSKNDSTEETLYPHRDHLGSVTEVTDANHNFAEPAPLSYDIWGKRRNADWSDASAQIFPAKTPRGYTFHEHLDDMSIIHMNARTYDPSLGRMLSPDPFVQFRGDSQSYNRFSYVLNNPLAYTDPSGYEPIPIPIGVFGGPAGWAAMAVISVWKWHKHQHHHGRSQPPPFSGPSHSVTTNGQPLFGKLWGRPLAATRSTALGGRGVCSLSTACHGKYDLNLNNYADVTGPWDYDTEDYEKPLNTDWTAEEWEEIAWDSFKMQELIKKWSVKDLRAVGYHRLDHAQDSDIDFFVRQQLLTSVAMWQLNAIQKHTREVAHDYPIQLATDLALAKAGRVIEGLAEMPAVLKGLAQPVLRAIGQASTIVGERQGSTIYWTCGLHRTEGWFCAPHRK